MVGRSRVLHRFLKSEVELLEFEVNSSIWRQHSLPLTSLTSPRSKSKKREGQSVEEQQEAAAGALRHDRHRGRRAVVAVDVAPRAPHSLLASLNSLAETPHPGTPRAAVCSMPVRRQARPWPSRAASSLCSRHALASAPRTPSSITTHHCPLWLARRCPGRPLAPSPPYAAAEPI